MFVLNNACFCFSLRAGGLILGWFYTVFGIVLSILCIGVSSYLLSQNQDSKFIIIRDQPYMEKTFCKLLHKLWNYFVKFMKFVFFSHNIFFGISNIFPDYNNCFNLIDYGNQTSKISRIWILRLRTYKFHNFRVAIRNW